MESIYRMGVFGSLQFEAIHCWPEAPKGDIFFLSHPHRHIFKLEFRAPVTHDNRDIEFITLKREVENFCNDKYAGKNIGATSCEMIGCAILDNFPQIGGVTVSEDGENGANVWRRNVT